MSYFDDVSDFQRNVLGVEKPSPRLPELEEALHQEMCLHEELEELRESLIDEDLASTADALADLIYFALGYAYRLGLPFDQIWAAVHQANMTKVRGLTHRGVEDDAAKPEMWVDPKITIRELLK